MTCDLCGGAVLLNRQDFVLREEPTNDRDVTLITYLAHQTCHELNVARDAAAQQSHWSFTWGPR